ncbi:hypothetical protein GCM10010394_47590 [Streptomyces crystallinus]|uniref:Uncharacterized protein n=1 Tax=Streptomyces crystallinus TaxID=68191 RepID=A0ABP3RKG3_9ACTN
MPGRAGVRPGTEGQVGAVSGPVGRGDGGIVVASGQGDDDRLVCGQHQLLAHRDGPGGVAQAVVRHRRVAEQRLVQGVPWREAAAEHTVGEARVGQQEQDSVGDQVLLGFDARAVKGDQLMDQLGLVQLRGVCHQAGGDVVAGVSAAQLDQLDQRLLEKGVACGRVTAALEDLRHAAGDARAGLGRAAEYVVEGVERHGPGEVGDHVGVPG